MGSALDQGYGNAATFALLGGTELALRLVRELVDRRDGWAVFLTVDPHLRRSAVDSRFTALLAEMGLQPSSDAPPR